MVGYKITIYLFIFIYIYIYFTMIFFRKILKMNIKNIE